MPKESKVYWEKEHLKMEKLRSQEEKLAEKTKNQRTKTLEVSESQFIRVTMLTAYINKILRANNTLLPY